jgi:glutamine amidotransferase of anthranilate synthase or aminodeoxychorismate synthase
MKILLINNYDSFVYNLLHLIKEACDTTPEIDIITNDCINFSHITDYESIIISPGPGIPSEAGDIIQLIKNWGPTIPILGVCLGHQAIAEAFNGKIYRFSTPMHGVQSQIKILDKSGIFKGLNTSIKCGRYHSWLVDEGSLPESLKITAIDNDGRIMALSHCRYNIHGVQFHPESFLTENGIQIIRNFLNIN